MIVSDRFRSMPWPRVPVRRQVRNTFVVSRLTGSWIAQEFAGAIVCEFDRLLIELRERGPVLLQSRQVDSATPGSSLACPDPVEDVRQRLNLVFDETYESKRVWSPLRLKPAPSNRSSRASSLLSILRTEHQTEFRVRDRYSPRPVRPVSCGACDVSSYYTSR
jgi:hypothetical protein